MSSDLKQSEPPGVRPEIDPIGLVICVLGVFIACDIVIWPILMSAKPPDFFAMVLCIGLCVQLCLTAVWLAYGGIAAPLRMIAAGVPVLLLCIPAFKYGNFIGTFVGVYLFLVLFSFPCALARLVGCQIRQFANQAAIDAWRVGTRQSQFTLRQMFAWTTALALLAGMARSVELPRGIFRGEFLFLALISLIPGFVLRITVWAALSENKPWPRIGWTAAAALVGGMLWLMKLGILNEPQAWPLLLASPSAVFAIGGVLLIFRAYGFRYVRPQRRRRAELPAARESLPNPAPVPNPFAD